MRGPVANVGVSGDTHCGVVLPTRAPIFDLIVVRTRACLPILSDVVVELKEDLGEQYRVRQYVANPSEFIVRRLLSTS